MNNKMTLHISLDTLEFEESMKKATTAIAQLGGAISGTGHGMDKSEEHKKALDEITKYFQGLAKKEPLLDIQPAHYPLDEDAHAWHSHSTAGWYKWSPSPANISIGGIDEYASPILKIPSKPVVVIDPALHGNAATITIKITMVKDYMLKYKGCTGEAARVLAEAVEGEILKQLIALNKELHEGGA